MTPADGHARQNRTSGEPARVKDNLNQFARRTQIAGVSRPGAGEDAHRNEAHQQEEQRLDRAGFE